MFSFLLQCTLSTPKVFERGYLDIVIDKVRSGRLDIGFFNREAPNWFATLEPGLKCLRGEYCFRGVNASNYNPGNSVSFGSVFLDKVETKPADYPTSPCNIPYMICSVPRNEQTSPEIIITMKENADVPENAVPIGRLISGRNIIQKIANFVDSGNDINKVRVCTCGIQYDRDDDYDI